MMNGDDNLNGDESHSDAPPMEHPDAYDNPYFQISRRPRATTPGAVAVVRRGLESTELQHEEEWDPTVQVELEEESEGDVEEAPSPHQTYLDATVTPRRRNLYEMSTKRMLLYAFVAILMLGGAGAGIAVAVTNSMNSGSDSATEPPSNKDTADSQCYFADMAQPDPILQCACDGAITALTNKTRSNYIALKESFVPTLFPSFDYTMESCEPQNAALLWLAADNSDNQTLEIMQNRYLLSLLYAYWQGLDWKDDEGWLEAASECTWSGITCSGTLVTGVDLFDKNLTGSLVTELGLFPNIETFLLGMNELGGSIPSEIARGTSLEVLKLERNLIAGSIPASIGNLVNMKELYAPGNSLTGSIPAEIVNLISLEALDLSENDLTGGLPTNIGLLTSLKIILLGKNSLVGPIPESIGLVTNLVDFEIDENQLTGTLPLSFFDLTTLKSLSVGFNNFDSSPIPTAVGQLTNLDSLSIPKIALNGTIPSVMGNLVKLFFLRLDSNEFTGTIPATLGNLVLVEEMYFQFNQLQGSMPQEVCALTEVGVLDWLVVDCAESIGPNCDCCIYCTR